MSDIMSKEFNDAQGDAVKQWNEYVAKSVEDALQSLHVLDGAFLSLSYPSGFNYAIQLGDGYNSASLNSLDSLVSDSGGA